MKSALFVLLGPVVWLSHVRATGLDPVDNFCSRWYHQSQIKNDILFIDGGIEAFTDRTLYNGPAGDGAKYTGPRILGPNNHVIAVDMRTTWDWKTNISESVINKTRALGTENYIPNVQSAALFHGMPDDPQIYLYGGVTPDINTSFPEFQTPTTSQYTLWGFNTDSHGWTQYDVLLDVPQRPSWGASAELPELGLGFYLNGLINNMSALNTGDAAPTNLGGMVVLDLQNQTAKNISTDTVADSPRVRGGLAAIPRIGTRGVLVSFGGATGIGDSLRPVSMTQVNIFDVEYAMTISESRSDSGWYTQTITGEDMPAPRVDFCVVVANAPDSSSYNIYMYGGWDPVQTEYFDDIWVLSIPSFTWIKVFGGNSPRFGHSCHFVGNRQMVTVGGIGNGTNVTNECDWEYRGVAMFDLTALGWGSVYHSDKPPYQVASKISNVIGGGPDGAATKLFPDGGWTSTLVARLFTGSTSQTAPYSPPKSSGSATAGGGASSGSGGPNVGAIVGGVVGGVAFLALIGLAAFFWWRRHSKRAPPAEEVPPDPPPKPVEAGGEALIELLASRPEVAELDGGSSPLSPTGRSELDSHEMHEMHDHHNIREREGSR